MTSYRIGTLAEYRTECIPIMQGPGVLQKEIQPIVRLLIVSEKETVNLLSCILCVHFSTVTNYTFDNFSSTLDYYTLFSIAHF